MLYGSSEAAQLIPHRAANVASILTQQTNLIYSLNIPI
jgi:hypothetical protein